MERLVRVSMTLILSWIVFAAGTLWVLGENIPEDDTLYSKINARAAVLADGDTGRILWGKNEDEAMAMASTTKIMTCLVALENCDLNENVSISEYAASMPDVQLNAVAGDVFRMEDLLYALMLESDNDVAVAIAEHVGGSVESFAEMMNGRARKMGCERTCFVTPNGLDAPGHATTATELAKIASEAIKNTDFVKIIGTEYHSFSNTDDTRHYEVSNKNAFLSMMPGAFGIKTGFTGDAGYCFVGALEDDGRRFISVVLGSGWPPDKNLKWTDTRNLMNYGLEHFHRKETSIKNIKMGEIKVEGGVKDTVLLMVEDIPEEILMGDTEEIQISSMYLLSCKAPVEKHTLVGQVNFKIGDDIVKNCKIYTEETVEKKTFLFAVKKIFTEWIGL